MSLLLVLSAAAPAAAAPVGVAVPSPLPARALEVVVPEGSDPFEPDDSLETAHAFTVDGAPEVRTVFPAGDADLASIEGLAGVAYVIETLAPLPGHDTDTCLELYGTDGVTLLAFDDDAGQGLYSRLEWTCPASGTYLFRVRGYSGTTSGAYSLSAGVRSLVRGRLLGSDGATIPAAYVEAYRGDGAGGWAPALRAEPDGSGLYEIALTSGAYRLAFGDESGRYLGECWDDVPTGDVADERCATVVLSPGAVFAADERLERSPHVAGTVRGAGGTKVTTAYAAAHRPDGLGGWELAEYAAVDGSGRYEIDLPPGEYRLAFWDSSGRYLPQCWDAVPTEDVADPRCATIALAEGAAVTADAYLVRAPHVFGTIRGADGGTVAEPYAAAYRGDGAGGWELADYVRADSFGRYDLPLDPGTYRLAFFDETGRYLPECYDDVHTNDISDPACTTLVVGEAGGVQADAVLEADLVTPRTTILGLPEGWARSPVEITLSAADDLGIAATYYRLGSGPAQVYQGPFTLSAEGTTAVQYWSVDTAVPPNTEPARTATVRIDMSPPAAPSAPAWTALSPTAARLSWNAATDAHSGVAGYRVFDAASGTTLTAALEPGLSAEVAGLSPSTAYGFVIRAEDRAGNVSAPSAVVTLTTPAASWSGGVKPDAAETVIAVPSAGATMSVGVTFENVSAAGTVSVSPVAEPPAGVPAGTIVDGPYLDMSFTGAHEGWVYVTLPYDPALPLERALRLRLFALTPAGWEDVTWSVDTGASTITGRLTALSPVVVAERREPKPSAITLGSAPAYPAFGAAVTLSGRLADVSGTPIPGRSVTLQGSRDGKTWTTVTSMTTTAGTGAFTARVRPAYKTWYRAVFGGESVAAPSLSPVRIVMPAASISRVRALSTTIRAGVPCSFIGALAPRHRAGSGGITVEAQQLVAGSWRTMRGGRGTMVTATTWKAAVTFGRKGTWRVRAVHADADHRRTYGTWMRVTVR